MEEEIRRAKYKQLLNKLYQIKNKYQDLEIAYDDLNNCIKENLLINNKNIVEDEFSKIKKNSDLLKEELVNTIIPSINSKS